MKKMMKLAFVAVIAAVAGYNVYQSQSVMNGMSEFALANVEALANDENNPCSDPSHCFSMGGEECWYYVITGNHNQMIQKLDNHIHRGTN